MYQDSEHGISVLPPTQNKQRLGWIDYAKGIAIVLVVYRHLAYGLLASDISLPKAITDTNDMLYSFRMPLFFLLSGAFFERSLRSRGTRGFAINKVNTLLYPYILWAIIQISLQIVFSSFTNASRSGLDFLNIIVQPRKLDQLWYLFALFNVTIIYLLVSLVTGDRKGWQLLIGLVLLGIAPYVVSHSALYDICLHYIFFAIGDWGSRYFFSEDTQQRLSNPVNLLIALPVFAALQWYYLLHQGMNLYVYMLIALNGCLFVMLLSSYLARTGTFSFLRIIGNYSLYIYLLHVTIAAALRMILIEAGIDNGTVLLLILIPVSIVLSIRIYRACMHLKLGFLFKGPLEEKRLKHRPK
ncbi:acyltransferase [Chitinophaga sp. 212800010-3]|uniref:acyltransferase n=1 Tax=unclassified Chitinophaga TaxID=2619133 RepID=UPI002DE7E98C|nr:Acyl-transf-3 domain-containing protein [Chitinophaga sp. 212800010-3]